MENNKVLEKKVNLERKERKKLRIFDGDEIRKKEKKIECMS